MLKKIISAFFILQLGYNIAFSQTTDYPATKKTKEPISPSKCNKVKLPILDTTITLCNSKTDTVIGKKKLNGKLIDYKVLFFGNIGTCEITITDNSEDNKAKDILYKIKGSTKKYRFEKELICDVYGNCKSMKVKVYTPVLIKKILQN